MVYPKIPLQREGEFHDVVSMHCAENIEMALRKFESVERRLISVNDWHSLSPNVKAKFQQFHSETHEPTSALKVGNFIRIEIPGPGNPSGNGYDWTKISDIQIGSDNEILPFFAMTIIPCAAPDTTENTVAHFYGDESSNTFVIRRIGDCLYTEVHGRNQLANTSDVPLLDSIRNKAIVLGSKIGIGSLNWLAFSEAILNPS